MKSIFKATIFAASAAMIIGLASCGGGMKANITKKWKMSEMMMDTKKMAGDMVIEMTMDFKSDGTYEMSAMGSTRKGKWTLDEDKKMLSMTEEGSDKAEEGKIDECTSDKLVLSDEKSKTKMTWVPAGAEAEKK